MTLHHDGTRPGRSRDRIATLALAFAAVAAWALFFTFDGVATPRIGETLSARLQAHAGLIVEGVRNARFRPLPLPHVEFVDVAARSADGAVEARLPHIAASLKWAPLLLGRIEIAELALRAPRLRIRTDESGAAALTRRLVASAALHVGRLRVERGQTTFERAGGADGDLDDITLDLRWRALSSPASLEGGARWRGERVDISGWLAQPMELIAYRESAARLRARAGLGEFSFDGAVGGELGASLSGRVVASGVSLRRFLNFARFDAPLPDPIGAFEMTAQASSRGQALSFSDVELTLDSNRFEGSLSLRREDGRPSIAGTLATAELDVGPWLDAAPAPLDARGRWSEAAIDWRREESGNLDLRVSAARVRAGRLRLGETALSLLMKRGRLEFALSEAAAYKGVLRGRLSMARSRGAGLEAKASLQWSDVDVGALLAAVQKKSRLTGVSNGQLVVEASGASVAALAAALEGRAHIALRNGELARLDLEQALRRTDRRGAALLANVSGRTGFDAISATLRASRGVANVEDAQLRGPGVTAIARGAVNVGEQSLSVRVDAAQSGALAAPLRMSFYVAGPWDGPRILPEPDPPRQPPTR